MTINHCLIERDPGYIRNLQNPPVHPLLDTLNHLPSLASVQGDIESHELRLVYLKRLESLLLEIGSGQTLYPVNQSIQLTPIQQQQESVHHVQTLDCTCKQDKDWGESGSPSREKVPCNAHEDSAQQSPCTHGHRERIQAERFAVSESSHRKTQPSPASKAPLASDRQSPEQKTSSD